MGAKIRATHAREVANKALREADRAEAEAWSIRMEGYGGPAQPSPTIAQCIHGGLGWLDVGCNRCTTGASLPLDARKRGELDRLRRELSPVSAIADPVRHRNLSNVALMDLRN